MKIAFTALLTIGFLLLMWFNFSRLIPAFNAGNDMTGTGFLILVHLIATAVITGSEIYSASPLVS